jgi:trans-aconitate methyltransferase
MTAPDNETLGVYAARAAQYLRLTSGDQPDHGLDAFINALPTGARVHDLGCGPGKSAAQMKAAGLIVDASDASPEMVTMACDRFDVAAQLAGFGDLKAIQIYDGVYANFSLLHAPKSQFADHLLSIHRALKPNGILHLAMKLGTGERRDTLGRFYAYYSAQELNDHLAAAGFSTVAKQTDEALGLAGEMEPFITITAHA